LSAWWGYLQVEGDFAEEDSAKSLVVVQGTISHIVLGSIRIKAKYAQIMETHSFQIHSNTILDCFLHQCASFTS
jgi:hypothetical protein